MRRIRWSFHGWPNSTRSDCSGATARSQAVDWQFMVRTLELAHQCDIFCYDGAVKRLAVEQGVKQGRLLLKHILPAIWKPIHALWHEVIAFVFLSLGIWSGSWAVRHLHERS